MIQEIIMWVSGRRWIWNFKITRLWPENFVTGCMFLSKLKPLTMFKSVALESVFMMSGGVIINSIVILLGIVQFHSEWWALKSPRRNVLTSKLRGFLTSAVMFFARYHWELYWEKVNRGEPKTIICIHTMWGEKQGKI